MPGQGGNRTYDLWNTSPVAVDICYSYILEGVDVQNIPVFQVFFNYSKKSPNGKILFLSSPGTSK